MFRPSGEYAILVTLPVCPVSGSPTAAPVSASQIRTVLSADPEATLRPSGEYARLQTALVCPCHTFEGAGQDVMRPLNTLMISGNEALLLFHKLDPVGVKGRTDMYMCAALVEIGVKKASTKRNASSIRPR
jgi:hypothetical protein